MVVLALAATGIAARAQEVRRIEPVVVTATKLETPAAELGASVTVVTEEDFRTYHYASVEEALRRVPGVEVQRQGSLGKATSITIRGAAGNQIQVMIDGVRVKSPTLGVAEFANIAPDLIERIEVIRGPQSTLHGADAMGGVVNIITKKGKGPFAATFHQEAGTYDTFRTQAGFSGSWRLLDYAFSASHRESNGQFMNDASEQNAVSGRLGLTLPGESSVAFLMRYTRNDTELPIKFLSTNFTGLQPIVPLIDSNNEQQDETWVLSLQGRTRPVPWWESELRLSRFQNTSVFVDLPDQADQCPFGPPCEFPSIIKVERRDVEWINHLHLGRWSTSSVGLEYRHAEGDNRGPNTAPFHVRTWTSSVFFQQQLRLFDRLFASAGFRVEDNNVFGTVTTERGSLALVVKEWGTRLRGGAGAGFRAPTLNEQFFPGFSDPTLRPEVSFGYDFGVDQTLAASRVRLGLTYFQTNYENLIGFVFTAVAPFVRGVNEGRARAAGIEFTSEVDLLDSLVASVNYTYTDTETLATDRPFRRQPRHRWNVGLAWEPVRGLSLFGQVLAVTRQLEGGRGPYNSGYTRVDVGGTYRLLDRRGYLRSVDATLRVENLLNEGYAEVRGFPALGTHVLAGLRMAF
jgi:vitamin B12 transporter